MPEIVRIHLQPIGRTLELPSGSSLQEALFGFGVEFPCGGLGICKGCRVKVTSGDVPPSEQDRAAFDPEEIRQGWRLACRLRPQQDLTLEVTQWETPVLTGQAAFPFTPRKGVGVAVDLGTTTIAAQALDLRTGHVTGTRTALNPQAAWGSDVMSRIQAAVSGGLAGPLTDSVRSRVGEMVSELAAGLDLRDVVVVGNTVMHHLFCGLDLDPLSHVPFESPHGGLVTLGPSSLPWLDDHATLRFLPCLGGFVGSDILAGILATGIHQSAQPACLIDLGTNGEIVIGNQERMLCASTAAGPAFEGGRIRMGMRADAGAIWRIERSPQGFECRLLGSGPPRGICGSGLVDAAAVGLDLGVLDPAGRLKQAEWLLAGAVRLFQADIRQLQLAKAAVASAIHILLSRLRLSPGDISRVYLAGAFGNYIRPSSARRIGLLPFSEAAILPSGNTALHGAKIALFDGGDYADLRSRIEHVPLASDPNFQEWFAASISFPAF
ncbi:MAG: ASKHA domain-containing protein [Bryobacteraceae bacterium]